MRAVTYSEYGDPSVLSVTEQPTPKVAPGAVLIKAHRASVNPVDWKLMAGYLDEMLDVVFPVIPGWDVSGVIEAVGSDVPEFAPGDRVAAYARKDFVQGGTFAEFVSVRAVDVAHVPDSVDVDVAAGLPLAGLTAQRSLEALNLTDRDIVLIHAASGGVGHLAAQLAVNLGATVIGTAGQRNHDKLRARGVTPVSYGPGLENRVREIAPEGVTAVADFAGEVVNQSLVVLTEADRQISVTDPEVLQHGGQLIWVRPDGQRLESLLAKIAEGRLSVDIDSVYPLAQAADALEKSKSGSPQGKIILDVTS